jgi:hypothetical protein
MKRIIDMGDRIELMKLAAEFAKDYQMKPLQMYHSMLAAVTTEPDPHCISGPPLE